MTVQNVQAGITSRLVEVSGRVRVSGETGALSSQVSGNCSRENDEAAGADSIDGEQNYKLQQCWQSTMCQELQIPDGYQDVSVLIIKWNGKLDELKTENEVERLERLFKERFHYNTKVVELDIESKPQHQLNTAITHTLNGFDGPHNLLIVYYTGHGSWNVDKEWLELHAYIFLVNLWREIEALIMNFRSSDGTKYKDAKHEPHAIWNSAERPLIEDADCDVLAIMDTCFASNVMKGLEVTQRAYLLLAASGHDKQTAGPGPNSFTTALIESLLALLKENKDGSFAVRALCDKINVRRRGANKANNQSQVLDRLKSYTSFIKLAPLKKSSAEREIEFKNDRTRALLTIDFSITEDLDGDKTKALAKDLSQAVKKHNVKRIDWAKLRVLPTFGEVVETQALRKKYGKRWLESTIRSRNKTSSATTKDQGSSTESTLCMGGNDLAATGPLLAQPESEVTPKKCVPQKRKPNELCADSNKRRLKDSSPKHNVEYQAPMTPRSDTETPSRTRD